MTFASDGATAIAPTDMMEVWSVNGAHVRPPSVAFQTPPATAPKEYVLGSPATPATARTRPPRNGPISRHFIPLSEFSLSVCASTSAPNINGMASAATHTSEPTIRLRFLMPTPPHQICGRILLWPVQYSYLEPPMPNERWRTAARGARAGGR